MAVVLFHVMEAFHLFLAVVLLHVLVQALVAFFSPVPCHGPLARLPMQEVKEQVLVMLKEVPLV